MPQRDRATVSLGPLVLRLGKSGNHAVCIGLLAGKGPVALHPSFT